MFFAIRLIILIVVIIPIFIFAKIKKTINKKKWYIISGVLAVIIMASVAFPVENMIMKFSTPETAFKYVMGNNNIAQVVDGEQSSFVIGKKQDSYIYLIIPKADESWKIDYGINTKLITQKLVNGVAIHVYQYKNSSDYYITILDVNGGFTNISDNLGSEFIPISKKNDSLNKTFVTYYAHISNINNQYQVTVNNTIIELNN